SEGCIALCLARALEAHAAAEARDHRAQEAGQRQLGPAELDVGPHDIGLPARTAALVEGLELSFRVQQIQLPVAADADAAASLEPAVFRSRDGAVHAHQAEALQITPSQLVSDRRVTHFTLELRAQSAV